MFIYSSRITSSIKRLFLLNSIKRLFLLNSIKRLFLLDKGIAKIQYLLEKEIV